MKKRLLPALLAALFIWATPLSVPVLADPDTETAAEEPVLLKNGSQGDNVILLQIRLRDLDYYNYKITGTFGAFTAKAVETFQKENGLTADGVAGQATLDVLFSNAAKRKPVKAVVKPVVIDTSKVRTAKYGNMRDWFTYVNRRWPRGTKAKVMDFNTGKIYNMIRVGGYNHADVEPATKKDCATFKSTYGGKWSWTRRAVIVYIKGEAIAASTNGMPHGYETIPNNDMYEQVCIHFLNSRTHEKNMRDPAHQAMVRRAAGK
jgi:peptidoglycan hydrolase-like protein with peptidoglycan-binding domain